MSNNESVEIDAESCPVNPINVDPNDSTHITLYPHIIFGENTQTLPSEHYPQAELPHIQQVHTPYQGLPNTINMNSSSKEVMSEMKKLRTKEQNIIWNDMANYGNHLGDRAVKGLTTMYGTLHPNASKDLKRKADRKELTADELERRQKKKRLKEQAKSKKVASANPKSTYLTVPFSGAVATGSPPGSLVGSPASSTASSAASSRASSVLSLQEFDAQPPLLPAIPGPAITSSGKRSKKEPPTGGVVFDRNVLHPEPKIPFDERYKKIGTDEGSMRNTVSNLNLADYVIWKALQTEYKCDNQPVATAGLEGYKFPYVDAEQIVGKIRQKHSSKTAWAELGYKHTPKSQLRKLPPGGFVIRDAKGKLLVAHLPGIYRPGQIEYYNHSLVHLRNKLKTMVKQSDTKPGKRGDTKTYATAANRPLEQYPIGSINLATAWTSEGQAIGNSRPAKSMIAASGAVVEDFVAVQEHFSSIRSLITIQNYALYKIAPESFWAQLKVRTILHKKLPAVRAISSNDPSVMSGRSYIYNRNTNLHFDEQEPPEGLIPLVVAGTCKTGYLALTGLGVKFDYLPGSMTFLRGRILEHGVVDWENDGNRFCIANFNHHQEWKSAGVDPVW